MDERIIERFWSRVAKGGPDECWPWTGFRLPYGYGRFHAGVPGHPSCMQAHRFAYLVITGDLPRDLDVLHECDNPPCCNPKHLFLGTDRTNTDDKMRKLRHGFGSIHSKAILTEAAVADMRRRASEGESYVNLAKEHGVDRWTAYDAVNRRTWRHIP